jgi:hypothetical protein
MASRLGFSNVTVPSRFLKAQGVRRTGWIVQITPTLRLTL